MSSARAIFHRQKPSSPSTTAASVPALSRHTSLPGAGTDARRHRFWLCLHFPDLPLEVLREVPEADAPETAAPGARSRAAPPRAVSGESGQRECIVVADARGIAAGVVPGMPVNSALALVPDLQLRPRDRARERTALARLATWAGRYTPAVSVESADSLLLEVGPSLRLFGGAAALQARLRGELLRKNHLRLHRVVITEAETARAAHWLAKAEAKGIANGNGFPSDPLRRLSALPISLAHWPERSLTLLAEMGVRTFGDCLRLPRQGFARRLGQAVLRDLDQAFGRVPEVCRWHEPPERFHETLALEEELQDRELLLHALHPLLDALGARLQSHQAGVRVLWCRLGHSRSAAMTADSDATWLRVGLRRPSGRRSLFMSLLKARLESTVLHAPVSSLMLLADLETASGPEGQDLLGQSLQPDAPLAELLDRLRARLGDDAVHGLARIPEHRPEWAWSALRDLPLSPVPSKSGKSRCDQDGTGTTRRPVWLLPHPRYLHSVSGQPTWRGRLSLEAGPERIETGWWDGSDIRRDYFRARHPDGMLLWVFRDLRSDRWYLHGLFG